MTVYVVMCNGRLSEVFDNEEAARHHSRQLMSRWNMTEVLVREVRSL